MLDSPDRVLDNETGKSVQERTGETLLVSRKDLTDTIRLLEGAKNKLRLLLNRI